MKRDAIARAQTDRINRLERLLAQAKKDRDADRKRAQSEGFQAAVTRISEFVENWDSFIYSARPHGVDGWASMKKLAADIRVTFLRAI